MRRLKCLECKFQLNSKFHVQYMEFMREYLELRHMSEVMKEINSTSPVFLPHHGVIRESSATTKLRVVFDGSAKSTSGISLNDTLKVGANMQDTITDIILRFRMHVIAITADLQKMYRQVLVHNQDRNYQRILWRFSATDAIREFNLNTVTYGLACAPFLAIRCVRHLASSANDEFRQASHVLLNDLYVDDILTGVSCKNEAIKLISQLKTLLNSDGFEPHKWHSNCTEVLEASNRVDESATVTINVDTVKTLGLN